MSWKLIYFEDHWAWQARTNDPIFLARISIENCSRPVCTSTSQSSLHTYNTADTLSANAFFCGDKNIDFSIEDQQGITRKNMTFSFIFVAFIYCKHVIIKSTCVYKIRTIYVLGGKKFHIWSRLCRHPLPLLRFRVKRMFVYVCQGILYKKRRLEIKDLVVKSSKLYPNLKTNVHVRIIV